MPKGWVRGHWVRRNGTVYWRKGHFRKNSDLGTLLVDIISSGVKALRRMWRSRPTQSTSRRPALKHPTPPPVIKPLAPSARQQIADVARATCDLSWKYRVTHNAQRALSPVTLGRQPTPCTKQTCDELAETARSLEVAKVRLHDMSGRTAEAVVERFGGGGSFARRAAYEIGKRVPINTPADEVLRSTAICLRALGILCCINANRDIAECDCLFNLGKGLGKRELEGRLKEMAIDRLWPTYG